MKLFKAEWKHEITEGTPIGKIYRPSRTETIDHLITQHNALCDFLAEREELPEQWGKDVFTGERKEIPISKTITLPKPEWWNGIDTYDERVYLEALSDTSKAMGVIIKLED